MAHHFAETQPLSTYQIAFAAGPWHVATATAGATHDQRLGARARAPARPTSTRCSRQNLAALAWMERYFARPYPFDKFAFLLAPAFPFGGMEHPGAVFYNEDRFIFRERPTLPQRLGRTSTILHEVAHMWFGDLVTMRWFDDLWLKEGFATYMAAKALADLDSTSGAWKTFYLANKPAAYGVDQTDGTTPLWQALDNLDQAKSAYGAIVYNKAPAVLKQLNYLVGEPAFRAGVQTVPRAPRVRQRDLEGPADGDRPRRGPPARRLRPPVHPAARDARGRAARHGQERHDRESRTGPAAGASALGSGGRGRCGRRSCSRTRTGRP